MMWRRFVNMDEKKFYLGLDVGTDSIGWCLTDQDYNIIKKQGKSLWGVRMFDGAETAEERRSYRGQRRRIDRQRERIDLLQDLFATEMNKVDPTFFQRLNESAYQFDDREINRENQYTLFIKKDYTDKDYFREYPTIFHLKKHLLESDQKEDIRFIYLACHNILKHRGNFINEGFDPSEPLNSEKAEEYFSKIYDVGEKNSDALINFNYVGKTEDIYYAFCTKGGITLLKEELNTIFSGNPKGEKNIIYNLYIPLISGSKKSFKDLIKETDNDNDELDAEDLSKSLYLDDDQLEETILELKDKYPLLENELDAVLVSKEIRDMFVLGKILGKGNSYISVSMVNQYEENKRDLKALKLYVKNNYPEKEYLIFRKVEDKLNNYVSYIGYTNVSGKTTNAISRCSAEDFYKFLRKELEMDDEKNNNNEFLQSIKQKMDAGTYLLKLRNSTNGRYPYQLNELELCTILDKQSKYYDFLNDEDGNSKCPKVKDKIVSLLTFKIPYYVGPLFSSNKENDNRKKYSWIIKNENSKIVPWNFNQVVNQDETAEEFIRRMQNKCTYLMGPDDYCLPKKSILFSYFNLLNFINKIYVNGIPMSKEDRDAIIKELYFVKKNVSVKNIKDWYKKNHDTKNEVSVTTSNLKDVEADNLPTMDSYITLKNIFSFSDEEMWEKLDDLEQIIKDVTIFEDKSMLERKLNGQKSNYPSLNLTPRIISSIKGLSYTGWARLSKKLLVGIKGSEGYSILKVMNMKSMNFNEALYSDNFLSVIDEYNKKFNYDPSNMPLNDYIDGLYANPAVKRSLTQTCHIIDELQHIVGCPIDKYFIEFTRHDAEKKRTVSRKDNMIGLYKTIKENMFDEKLKDQLSNEVDLRSDRLYLYYTQHGKCMYSGDPIDLSRLSEDYEIDHIIPWSIDNNDSFDNKVLVKKECNQEKTNIYPLDTTRIWVKHGGYNAACQYWELLKDYKLISAEKYRRLTRRAKLEDSDYEDFINRQLVSTNQTTKSLADLLVDYYHVDKQNIVYSKANNVSYYRNRFNIYKSRTANNFHHAHDAYLNIVIGNVTNEYFKNKHIHDLYDEEHVLTTNIEKVFDKDVVKSIDGRVIYNKVKFLQMVEKNIFNRFDIMTTTRAYEDNSLFSKTTVKPKGVGKYPVKSTGPLSDASKYGGFTDPKYCFYALMKTKDKNGEKTVLVPIPALYRNDLDNYFENILGYGNNYSIVVPKVKINSVIYTGKTKFKITGVSNNSFLIQNAKERIFSKSEIKTIHDIDKFLDLLKKQRIAVNDKLFDSTDSKYQDSFSKIFKQFDYRLNNGDSELVVSPSSDKNKEGIKLNKNQIVNLYCKIHDLFVKVDTSGNKEFDFSNIQKIASAMIDKKTLFNSLDLIQEIYVVSELLNLLKCNERSSADLHFLGLSSNSGIITISQAFTGHFKLVSESATGFYKKVLYKQ